MDPEYTHMILSSANGNDQTAMICLHRLQIAAGGLTLSKLVEIVRVMLVNMISGTLPSRSFCNSLWQAHIVAQRGSQHVADVCKRLDCIVNVIQMDAVHDEAYNRFVRYINRNSVYELVEVLTEFYGYHQCDCFKCT